MLEGIQWAGTIRRRSGSGLVGFDQLELVGPSAYDIVCLAAALAAISEVDPLGGFLTSFGLRSWKTAIPCGDSTETPLSPLEFRGSLFLDPFDIMIGMMLTVRAICLDDSRKFHSDPLLKYRCSPALQSLY